MTYLTNRIALIDGDIIAFRAAIWARDHQADHLDLIELIDTTMAQWMAAAHATDAILTFSCPRDEGFRRKAYPPYKAHRDGTAPPMLHDAKAHLSQAYRVVTLPTLEADDVMGILATAGKIENPVIVTSDKDLRQIPGWHVNPYKEDFPVQVSELQADHLFFVQWLAGDATDGFKGIRGVGPAKAKKILNHEPLLEIADVEITTENQWAFCALSAYFEAGLTTDEALAQARCARILRASDFDRDSLTPRLWAPSPEVLGTASGYWTQQEAICGH